MCLGGLILTFLCLGRAAGQERSSGETGMQAPYPPPGGAPPNRGEPPVYGPGLSEWLEYPRSPHCCGPVGANGPINSELYVRSGFIFPVGGGALNRNLYNGWAIEAGGRVLFFNPAIDRAWTIDLGIVNIYNNAHGNSQQFTLFNAPVRVAGPTGTPVITNFPVVSASPADLNQTFASLSGGREWYLWGTADCGRGAPNWRAGFDAGGRWGTGKLDMHEINHRLDVIGTAFFALHTDIEYPCGCCTPFAGLRGEYGYTWTDLLQHQNRADVPYLGLLFNLGVRF
jgi:hypothetical protein